MNKSLKAFWQRYYVALIAGTISFVICFLLMLMFFCRNYAIGTLKNQFEELERALQSIGYDYAYDDMRFYSFSPWQIMRAKNFRIYSLDDKDFWQWSVEELNIDVGLFNNKSVDIFLGNRQEIQRDKKAWAVTLPGADIKLRLKDRAARDVELALSNIHVEHLFKIDSLKVNIRHQKLPYLSAKIDVQGVHIDDMTGWPLNKLISHIYLDASLQGQWDSQTLVSDAFYEWVDRGGQVDVHKAILNWKPLIMVANGNITFNENADPTMSLNTASLAMLETLDKLQQNGYISSKGTFVAKILLGNKAVQQNVTDKYKTVVTPLKISKEAVILENIKIR